MKKQELISIEEQMYAKGIWKRPILADGYKKHKGIRIISEDGTTLRTKVIDGESGKDIPYIYKVELTGRVGELWDVVLYGHKCMLDITTGKYRIKRKGI